ncbi:DsrE family protein [Corallococcus macrosporus]|uniref:DsrE family protein n=1 Tax=Corallococcus macrosporus TaxID=35 RepID=A0ABS3DIW3_9BACT|nr:DsrE family protein [Corallococcus macrosporus]MBN8231266.1 DsrE family protein [Corallococcus macrosporus]
MHRTLFTLLAALLLAVPAAALAASPDARPPRPAQKGKLVFVATTGLEDVGTLTSSFRHAVAAKESGYLSDVVWLSYGRSIVSLDPTVKAVPESVRQAAEKARAAGVRLVACGSALKKYDIDPKKLQPAAEVVPNGVAELSRLVAEGYQVIRY